MKKGSKQKISKKFCESEYGKKVEKHCRIINIVFFVFLVLYFGLIYSEAKKTIDNYDVYALIMEISTEVVFIISVYFDGIYAGALKQFKKLTE